MSVICHTDATEKNRIFTRVKIRYFLRVKISFYDTASFIYFVYSKNLDFFCECF